MRRYGDTDLATCLPRRTPRPIFCDADETPFGSGGRCPSYPLHPRSIERVPDGHPRHKTMREDDEVTRLDPQDKL